MKKILLWTLTLFIAIATMVYQRMTGPTYPKKVDITLDQSDYHLPLLRSNEIGSPCEIKVPVEDQSVKANLYYRRYNTSDKWTKVAMQRKSDHEKAFFGEGKEISVLFETLPEQPPAGKVEYYIEVYKGNEKVFIQKENPIVLRFKGYVPRSVLYPHIVFMVISLILGVRAGIEALFKGKHTYIFTLITLIALGIGGLFLGPIVQFNAFGDYWTGWPFGSDWTDNKTLFSFVFWVIAFIKLRKDRKNRLWPLIALIVMFSIYLIPHSMGGSEFNPETGQVDTGLK
jgi:hypothetical protein